MEGRLASWCWDDGGGGCLKRLCFEMDVGLPMYIEILRPYMNLIYAIFMECL